MDIVQKAEIHFHDRDRVSLYLQSNSSDQLEKLGEIALGAFYAVRMMSNLGRGEPSETIAAALEAFPRTARQFASRSMVGNRSLIDYPGYDGCRQLFLDLRISDSGATLEVKPGVGYCAPASVAALEFHLARRRSNDDEFLRAFSSALAGCAAAYRNGLITLHNHAELVLPILAHSCPAYTGSLGRNDESLCLCAETSSRGERPAGRQVELGV